MDIKKSDLDAFCDGILSLENEKKELATEIKDRIEAFAKNHELDKKSVKKFIKEYKDAQKDKDEYTLVDYEADSLLQIAFPEFANETKEA
jgi:uncharacterized protein (UPF0335 family)